MLRLYWNTALLNLVQALGPKNVFVSILESGSQEDTKGALSDLEKKLNDLGVANRIQLGMTVQEQAVWVLDVPEEGKRDGWIFTGRNVTGWEPRRIPYLADLRNKAMEPLVEAPLSESGGVERTRYDTVLWINDVVFTVSHVRDANRGMRTDEEQTEDVTTLLATRDGNYAAACALDFSGNAEA